jgi:hypothetical protein
VSSDFYVGLCLTCILFVGILTEDYDLKKGKCSTRLVRDPGGEIQKRMSPSAVLPPLDNFCPVAALKPVTLRYKKEIGSAGTTQFGLVAEHVEKVNPDLVVRDAEGKPYSVRYDK